MIAEPFGELHFNQRNKEWFGRVNNIAPNIKVELSICLDNDQEDLSNKILLVRELAAESDAVIEKLYRLAYIRYKDTKWKVTMMKLGGQHA